MDLVSRIWQQDSICQRNPQVLWGCNHQLNIPPFAVSGKQMSNAENNYTNKIAKQRVHIERLICKVKTFQLLSRCILTSLFKM
ncbi:hypothetical protein KUTeg_015028, partial [Tegillarca granosa]